MFVDKQLYEQLKELKDSSLDLHEVYSRLDEDTTRFNAAYLWLYMNKDPRFNRLHEKNMLNWMDGNIEIKPEPEKKYRVYCSIGRDGGSDEWFTGIYRNNYILAINTWCEGPDDYFEPLTKNAIEAFQDQTGIKFPQSAWHEVNYEEEMPF